MLLLGAYTSKFQSTGWLAPISVALGAAVGFVFGTPAMCAVFLGMIALDAVTGIIASLKRGEKFTSSKLRNMFYKWVAYLVVLLVAGCLDAMLVHYKMAAWIHLGHLAG